jgi:hypothetical protein
MTWEWHCVTSKARSEKTMERLPYWFLPKASSCLVVVQAWIPGFMKTSHVRTTISNSRMGTRSEEWFNFLACLSSFRLLWQNWLGGLNKRCISHASGAWEVQNQGIGRLGVWWGASSWFALQTTFLLYPGKLWCFPLLTRTLIWFWGSHPHDLI